MKFEIEPVGFIFSERKDAIDGNWKSIPSCIELCPQYPPECLSGLADFSHIEIIYYFHKVDPETIVRGSEHPRENPGWPKVGIFAQRKKSRPNLLGLTISKLIRVEGRRIYIDKFDGIDQTPVIDIKPVFREYMPDSIEEIREPLWVPEMMKHYW